MFPCSRVENDVRLEVQVHLEQMKPLQISISAQGIKENFL
jgi:hypothetical protein